jgi:hypothetical protein
LKQGLGEEGYMVAQKALHDQLTKRGLDHATIEIEFDAEGCKPSEFEEEGYCPTTDSHSH